MKKALAILLVVMVSLSLLVACTSGKTAGSLSKGESTEQTMEGTEQTMEGTGTAGDDVMDGSVEDPYVSVNAEEDSKDAVSEAAADSGSIYTTPNEELTNFYDAFVKPEEQYDTIFSADETLSNDMNALAQIVTRVAPLGFFVGITEYDSILDGKLPLSMYDAVKEKNGDEIKFSSNFDYTEEKGAGIAGDKRTEQGTLNTSANTLTYETKLERKGKIIERAVIEAEILSDGTYLFQYITYSTMSNLRDTDEATKIAVFKRYCKEKYSSVNATFDSDADFTYDSIIGKDTISVDEMAQNYKVTGKFIVTDGKASYEKGKE